MQVLFLRLRVEMVNKTVVCFNVYFFYFVSYVLNSYLLTYLLNRSWRAPKSCCWDQYCWVY